MAKSGQRNSHPEIIERPELKSGPRLVLEAAVTVGLWIAFIYCLVPIAQMVTTSAVLKPFKVEAMTGAVPVSVNDLLDYGALAAGSPRGLPGLLRMVGALGLLATTTYLIWVLYNYMGFLVRTRKVRATSPARAEGTPTLRRARRAAGARRLALRTACVLLPLLAAGGIWSWPCSDATWREPSRRVEGVVEAPAIPAAGTCAVMEVAERIDTDAPLPAPARPLPADRGKAALRMVRKGDMLSMLIKETYGVYNSRLLMMVRQRNPVIKDADKIRIGEAILFPKDIRGRTRKRVLAENERVPRRLGLPSGEDSLLGPTGLRAIGRSPRGRPLPYRVREAVLPL